MTNPDVAARRASDLGGVILNGRTVFAFVIGACVPIPLASVGVTYLGELLLALVAVWVVLTRTGKRRFWSPLAVRFIVLLFVALFGYVITDLVRKTPMADYIRGWSKIAFIVTDFIALYYLMRRNPSAILTFFLGFHLTGLAVAAKVYGMDLVYNFSIYWKFWMALPVSVIPLCLLAVMGKRGIRPTAIFLILLGALHVVLDFRSLGLMCFVIAAILLATKQTRGGRLWVDRRVLVVSAVGCGILLGYLYYAGQAEHGERREASNAWRFGVTVALWKGIMRAPVIGNGSWSTDAQLLAWRDDAMEARGVSRYAAGRSSRFTGHSEVLQGWFEGGLLAAVFFFFYGFHLAAGIKRVVQRRVDHLTALILLLLLNAAWGFVFDALNGLVRLDIAVALMLICYLRTEQQVLVAAQNSFARR